MEVSKGHYFSFLQNPALVLGQCFYTLLSNLLSMANYARRVWTTQETPQTCLFTCSITMAQNNWYKMEFLILYDWALLTQQKPPCATLLEMRKGDLIHKVEYNAVMESFVQGMEPLVQIHEVMGTQRWMTITATGPLLRRLTTKHLNANKSDSRLVKLMKINVQCSLSSKTTTWIWIHPKQRKISSTKGYILES